MSSTKTSIKTLPSRVQCAKRVRPLVVAISSLISILLFLVPDTAKAIFDLAAQGIIEWILANLRILIAAMGDLMQWLISAQNDFLYIQGVGIGWRIMRDFVNMFFIGILVIIAFATIFDNQKYAAKAMLAKVIMAAILINFSLPITRTAIEIISFPSTIFIDAIGNNLQLQLAQALQMQAAEKNKDESIGETIVTNLVCGATTGGIPGFGTICKSLGSILSGLLGSIIINGLIQILILLIVAVIFFFMAIYMVIRIPILLFLIIISPVAWFAGTLPSGKAMYDNWSTNLVKWSFFPTILLFFIYFGLFFSTAIKASFTTLYGKDQQQLQMLSTPRNDFPLSLQQALLQGVALTFFYAGFVAANNYGHAAGSKVTEYSSKLLGKMKSGAAGFFTRYGPIGGRVKAGKEAAGQRWEQFKEEGFQPEGYMRWARPFYKGKEFQKAREERVAERFGVRGAASRSELMKQAEKERQILHGQADQHAREQVQRVGGDYNQHYNEFINGAEKRAGTGANNPRAIAIQQSMAARGLITNLDHLRDAMAKVGGVSSVQGKSILNNVDISQMDTESLKAMYYAKGKNSDFAGLVEARAKAGKKLMKDMQLEEKEAWKLYIQLNATAGREARDRATDDMIRYLDNIGFKDFNMDEIIWAKEELISKEKWGDFLKTLKSKRPDLHADYAIRPAKEGGGGKFDEEAPDPSTFAKGIESARQQLIYEALKNGMDIGKISGKVWKEDEDFIKALQVKVDSFGKPGNRQRENFVGQIKLGVSDAAQGAQDKLNILQKNIPHRDPGELDEEEKAKREKEMTEDKRHKHELHEQQIRTLKAQEEAARRGGRT